MEQVREMCNTLQEFVTRWGAAYNQEARSIGLFVQNPLNWTEQQKQFFARVFLHGRGHFSRFLWHLGAIAPSGEAKEKIINNISDELGMLGAKNLPSHDELYWLFMESLGIDRYTILSEEIVKQKNNLPFIKEFNNGHLEYILLREWDKAWAAFAAYEYLDNVDYKNLLHFARNIGVSGAGLEFFKVHIVVQHYEPTVAILQEIWNRNPDAVRDAFCFIAEHQLTLWRNLNNAVEAYK